MSVIQEADEDDDTIYSSSIISIKEAAIQRQSTLSKRKSPEKLTKVIKQDKGCKTNSIEPFTSTEPQQHAKPAPEDAQNEISTQLKSLVIKPESPFG